MYHVSWLSFKIATVYTITHTYTSWKQRKTRHKKTLKKNVNKLWYQILESEIANKQKTNVACLKWKKPVPSSGKCKTDIITNKKTRQDT